MEAWNEYTFIGCRWAGGKYIKPNYKQFNARGARFNTFEELQFAYPKAIDTTNRDHVETVTQKAVESVMACQPKRIRKETKGIYFIYIYYYFK